ncbi:MAG: hypothetical protein K5673_08765 [Lachnospiraceae bacterium]|nr:hypothetical protein [Lachnospiraceae bacterium]
MNFFDIVLTPLQLSGNNDGVGIALSVSPGYQYSDGIKTDNISHLKITTVFPDNSFDKCSVKVMDLKCPVTQEKIVSSGGKLKVKFKNLTGKLYRASTGEIMISASADSAEVAS